VREPSALGALEGQIAPGTKIAVDSAGHLVPDPALHKLMDDFLLKGRETDRAAMVGQLRAFLQASLRPPASSEADRLVSDYLAYLGAESQMLARERFAPADPSGLTDREIEHLLAWQQARAQLRERMLGVAVTQAWFGQADSTCVSAFEEWRKQQAPAGQDDEADSVELTERRLHGAALEERRNNNAQACAAQVMQTMAPRS
jgi:lipase chaperone LimK